jgi:hypothetical protein
MELTVRKYLIQIESIYRLLDAAAADTSENVGRLLDDWNSVNTGIAAMSEKGHRLIIGLAPIANLLERPAAAAAPTCSPEQAENIVALSSRSMICWMGPLQ